MTTKKDTKDTPGSGDKNDTSGKAAVEKPQPAGKGSGPVGVKEDKERKEMLDASLERAAKAAQEGGAAQPVVIVPTVDRLEFVGEEHRDVTNDPKFDRDKETNAEGTLPQHDRFVFDQKAKTKQVDHIATASNATGLVLVIDGTYYSFGPQLAAALGRLVRNASTNLNL